MKEQVNISLWSHVCNCNGKSIEPKQIYVKILKQSNDAIGYMLGSSRILPFEGRLHISYSRKDILYAILSHIAYSLNRVISPYKLLRMLYK